jgi:hypothetical protein
MNVSERLAKIGTHLAHGYWSNKQQALRDRPVLVPVAVIVVPTALFLVYEIRFG